MSKSEKPPLRPMTVGDGITQYSRPPTLLDEPYRSKAQVGALVDSRVRKSPSASLQEIRESIEAFCRDEFSGHGLPDPFMFIGRHTSSGLKPLPAADVLQRGASHVERQMNDLGYELSALVHTPDESSHTRLWYAARLATEFVKLDLIRVQAEEGHHTPGAAVMYAAATGVRIGDLYRGARMKFAHEDNALRGAATLKASSEGGTKRAKERREERAPAIEQMIRRVKRGELRTHAARQVIRELKLNVKPDTLVRQFNEAIKNTG